MNNDPQCKKKCLDCIHCIHSCNLSCRDCHRCQTFFQYNRQPPHDIPRDMFALTKGLPGKCDYRPTPMYCLGIPKTTAEANAKKITNSDVGLCYFCSIEDMHKPRKVFGPGTERLGLMNFSEYGGQYETTSQHFTN